MTMQRVERKNADFRAIADRIANDLFMNGAGKEADRLVLIKNDPTACTPDNLGGWCKLVVRDRVEAVLKAEFADPDLIPLKQAMGTVKKTRRGKGRRR